MARASLVAILALLVSGGAAIACTNSADDFGGGGSGGVSSRKREANAATGGIDGDPETPDEQTLTGGNPEEETPGTAQADAAPPPNTSSEAGAPPPGPDPIPNGAFAAGTELVTTANLNIRDGADTSYPIVATAPNGSRVTVVTTSGAGGWVNISWNGTAGWSSKAYLTLP
jgi:uncharacterized protein YgiM (DUF1202 family)